VPSFYAHGKLLLTGEYFVLAGARALALPLRLGQHLQVEKGEEQGVLSWTSLDENGRPWFRLRFALRDFSVLETSDVAFAERLQSIFFAIKRLRGNKPWLSPNESLCLSTRLEFSRSWGLGSSSTLLSCLARWAEVDPWQLSDMTFGGSGYDLAAAVSTTPFFFRRRKAEPDISPAPFDPPFRENLYFVYLGRKQNSREGIARFEERRSKLSDRLLEQVEEMSTAFTICRKADDFQRLMREHEQLVSDFLNLPRLQQQYFSDFKGAVKSLGAWGGDFALVCSEESEDYLRAYFNQKGLSLLFSYDDLAFAK